MHEIQQLEKEVPYIRKSTPTKYKFLRMATCLFYPIPISGIWEERVAISTLQSWKPGTFAFIINHPDQYLLICHPISPWHLRKKKPQLCFAWVPEHRHLVTIDFLSLISGLVSHRAPVPQARQRSGQIIGGRMQPPYPHTHQIRVAPLGNRSAKGEPSHDQTNSSRIRWNTVYHSGHKNCNRTGGSAPSPFSVSIRWH